MLKEPLKFTVKTKEFFFKYVSKIALENHNSERTANEKVWITGLLDTVAKAGISWNIRWQLVDLNNKVNFEA